MVKNNAIETLMLHRSKLTRQQFNTLKGQAITGNCEACIKGLNKILKRGF